MYTGDTRTRAILILAWGSNWGSSDFSRNQNNSGSSSAYVTFIYCGLSLKINMRKTPHNAQRSWMNLYCVCFMWSAKTWRPQFESHGWWCHYMGQYRRSGIFCVYLWKYPKLSSLLTKLWGATDGHITAVLCWCSGFKYVCKIWGLLMNVLQKYQINKKVTRSLVSNM